MSAWPSQSRTEANPRDVWTTTIRLPSCFDGPEWFSDLVAQDVGVRREHPSVWHHPLGSKWWVPNPNTGSFLPPPASLIVLALGDEPMLTAIAR